jgi:aldehyde:ferredoxin oxidoreductase
VREGVPVGSYHQCRSHGGKRFAAQAGSVEAESNHESGNMAMTFGWRGQFLRVNLTSGKLCSEALRPEEVKDWIGAHGLAIHLYNKEVPAEVEAGSAENALILATSPLTGTLLPNGGHYSVVTRATRGAGLSCANLGGAWGPELKYAGFDAIVVQGKSPRPVYLWISDGVAELRDAGHLWGKNVRECGDLLRAETDKKAHVCCIGPAGENRLGVAAIVSDAKFASGAKGVAAITGEKKLKAIVVRGTKGIRLARAAEFMEIAQRLRHDSATTILRGKGSRLQGPVLLVSAVAEDTEALPSDGVRPRSCFGCTTVFSSFADELTGETIARFHNESLPQIDAAQLREQRAFVDLGLDYVSAKTMLASGKSDDTQDQVDLAGKLARGELGENTEAEVNPGEVGNSGCVVGGYVLIPAIATAGLRDDSGVVLAAAESAGCCPFAAALMKAPEIASLLSSATGMDYSPEDVLRAGRRIATAAGK